MLDFVFRPIRGILGAGEHEVSKPFDETEHEILDAAEAIRHASDSIDRHVQVIEGLATSVGPLTESVDRLTATMADLVKLLGPLAGAEHEAQRAEHQAQRAERFFRLRRHEHEPAVEPSPSDAESPGS